MATQARHLPAKPVRIKPAPVIAIAKMTSKGQITVPKAVREHFGFEPGDEIAFIQDENGTYVCQYFREDPLDEWIGVAKDIKGSDVDAYIAEMRGR